MCSIIRRYFVICLANFGRLHNMLSKITNLMQVNAFFKFVFKYYFERYLVNV